MWPVVPFDQHFRFTINHVAEHHINVQDRIKFLLNKSVFDLVKVSHFLELTDPRLFGWYHSLPVEDRRLIQEEGGLFQFLHQHPALEVSQHIVHLKRIPLPPPGMSSNHERSRQDSFYGMSQCVRCGTSCPPGTKKCRHCSIVNSNRDENFCISEEEKALRLLPTNVREELNLLKTKQHVSECMSERSFQQIDLMQSVSNNSSSNQSKPLSSVQQLKNNSTDTQILCQMWKEKMSCDGKDVEVFEDFSAQASFLLDSELEMVGFRQSNVDDHAPLLEHTHADFLNQKEESLAEYYSFNSTTAEHTCAQSTDSIHTAVMATKGSTQTSITEEPVAYDAKNGTLPNLVSSCSNYCEWADLTECQNLNKENDPEFETKVDEFHSVTEDASSSAACIPCANLSMGQAVSARNDFTEITQDVFVNDCQDASTDSDSCPVNQETQTTRRPTFEKCTITEVYMSDLNAVYEEFEKVKTLEEELMHLKNEMTSAGRPKNEKQKCRCACGAVQRAIRAELRLLALQFAMCQQHCWRRLYTSPQCETSAQRTQALPDVMSQTLKSIEEDFLMMKSKILEGVPLDNLKPLSVDTKRLSGATCYMPSLIYGAFLGDSLLESSFNETNEMTSVLEDEGQTCQANQGLKRNRTEMGNPNKKSTPQVDLATVINPVSSGRSPDLPGSSQESGVSGNTKPDAAKDLNNSDTWFDAEEELGCDNQNCKEYRHIGQSDYMDLNKEPRGEVTSVREDQCLLLRVSNLPDSVTEHDLLLWLEKYHTNQVSLSNFSDGRVAIVSVRKPKDAEAAIREMDGLCIHGRVVHVEHIHESAADGEAIKESCIQLYPSAHKAGSAEEETITYSRSTNIHTVRPLRCSLAKLTNICTTPTASGTFVPQHYGTMGSFNTIMAQLSARHPKVGRQRFVNALLELQAKHHGALSGMLLKDIVNMTSELLNQSTRE